MPKKQNKKANGLKNKEFGKKNALRKEYSVFHSVNARHFHLIIF